MMMVFAKLMSACRRTGATVLYETCPLMPLDLDDFHFHHQLHNLRLRFLKTTKIT